VAVDGDRVRSRLIKMMKSSSVLLTALTAAAPETNAPEMGANMFVTFFQELRGGGVPVTLREFIILMQALEADLASRRVEDFYYLARAALVKDERNLDKFDRVFGHVFKGLELVSDAAAEAEIPAEWLKKLTEKYLTEDEKREIEALGGLDKLRTEGTSSGWLEVDRYRRHLALRRL